MEINKERYHRQLILEGFGESAQLKLAKAKVLVIGAGGLGCPALQYLVAAGTGSVGIVDDDTVSLSNLHRQVLYNTADVGKLKVEAAFNALIAQNPEVTILTHPIRVSKENILELLQGYDVIIDCTDNFPTKYMINDACALIGKPLIFAAVSAFEGQIAVFNVPDRLGECTNYRDLFPVQPAAHEIPSCAEAGVLGFLPGIIGAMQAAEAVKLIADLGEPLINRLLTYNVLNQRSYEVKLRRSADGSYTLPAGTEAFLSADYEQANCRIEASTVLEIDGIGLHKLLEEASTVVVDVRETHELPNVSFKNYRQIPMSVFNETVTAMLPEKNIILICQHGIRSLHAAEILSESSSESKMLYSLKGGIARWRNQF